jgi:hypothetical protein
LGKLYEHRVAGVSDSLNQIFCAVRIIGTPAFQFLAGNYNGTDSTAPKY